jgi:hypothetical protein
LDYLEKRPVALIRIFDPDAARSAEIRDFASLDQHPELILYEWHRETQGGEIEIFPLNEQSGNDPLIVDIYFITQKLPECPHMISNARCHSWSSMFPCYHANAIEALTKAAMGTGQIKISLIQMHLSLKPHDIFTEGNSLSSKAAVFVPQIQVVPFDVYRVDILEGDITEHRPFGNTHEMSLVIPLLDHLAITQRRTGHHLGPSRPTPLSRSGIDFKDMVAREESGAIRVHPVTDPQGHGLAAEPSFGVGHQRLGQRGLCCAKREGNHHPVLRGKGNPDPDFSLQRFALRRSSFFLTKPHRASNSTWATFNSFRSTAFTGSLCSAATRSQRRTVSILTSMTSATPRTGIPLTNSFKAIRTLSSGERRS